MRISCIYQGFLDKNDVYFEEDPGYRGILNVSMKKKAGKGPSESLSRFIFDFSLIGRESGCNRPGHSIISPLIHLLIWSGRPEKGRTQDPRIRSASPAERNFFSHPYAGRSS